METVYITGHRNPDTDSVVAAIAYAHFKQRFGIHAIPCRLGKLNPETKYLLDRFGFKEPMLFEDARPEIADIKMDAPLSISIDTTIHETLQLMKEKKCPTLAVVNSKNQILGLVSKNDLADIGLGDTAVGIDLLKETSAQNICKTIQGKMIYEEANMHFNGKVSIIAIAKDRLKNYEIQDRLVILGNDTESQIRAIEKGAAILIVVWADAIDDSVISLAKEKHCTIIISGHGSMNTSRYLYFSPAVNLIMKKDMISFNQNEFVEDVEKKMLKTRYRSYPVVDNSNRLIGYISRFHIMNVPPKNIILVDHNEYAQSVKGIEHANLLEVIDHHRVCDIITSHPILFRNEIIGSTASIITSIYRENRVKIEKNMAGILLGAIHSDTLKFRSPTTTPRDIELAIGLSKIAEVDIDTFAQDMFKVSANISQKSLDELLHQDVKHFEIDGINMMIGQVIVSSIEEIHAMETEFQKALDEECYRNGVDLQIVACTSLFENGSIFFAAGEKANVLLEAFPNKENERHSFHKNVLSRKNQMVPTLSKAIARMNN